eukprot:SM000205S06209  [mRNA]  locus=s205:77392:78968:- [translate_table: standard]
MSCNGCRVLRKGCSDMCVLRPCLSAIEGPDAQGHATVFLAKFFGRAGLLGFIAAVPERQRPEVFKSLLYEACGRTINPVFGSVGLLWSNNWHMCEAAVDCVLSGGTLQSLAEPAGPLFSPPPQAVANAGIGGGASCDSSSGGVRPLSCPMGPAPMACWPMPMNPLGAMGAAHMAHSAAVVAFQAATYQAASLQASRHAAATASASPFGYSTAPSQQLRDAAPLPHHLDQESGGSSPPSCTTAQHDGSSQQLQRQRSSNEPQPADQQLIAPVARRLYPQSASTGGGQSFLPGLAPQLTLGMGLRHGRPGACLAGPITCSSSPNGSASASASGGSVTSGWPSAPASGAFSVDAAPPEVTALGPWQPSGAVAVDAHRHHAPSHSFLPLMH